MRVALRSAASAIALALAVASPALAADGDVTFRLTIRGTPVPTDTFTLAVNAIDGPIVSPGILCGPPGPGLPRPRPLCEAGNYDFTTSLPVGTELEYTFARDEDYDGSAEGAEIVHTGSVTITAAPQVVTVVYDYSMDSLPDTSTAPVADSVTPALVATMVLLLSMGIRRTAARRLRS